MTVEESLLGEIVRRVLTVAKPDRIILFGSAATGQMTAGSDIDILVLEPAVHNRHEDSVAISDAIGDVPFAVDVKVICTERFEATKTSSAASRIRRTSTAECCTKPDDAEIRLLVGEWIRKADMDLNWRSG